MTENKINENQLSNLFWGEKKEKYNKNTLYFIGFILRFLKQLFYISFYYMTAARLYKVAEIAILKWPFTKYLNPRHMNNL